MVVLVLAILILEWDSNVNRLGTLKTIKTVVVVCLFDIKL